MEQLITAKKSLPKKQKIVCDYVLEHPEQVSVMALPDLAKQIGVGQTTIIRFINNVGFDSFKTFKKRFQAYTFESTKQPTWWQLEKSLSDSSSTIYKSWKEIMDVLGSSMTAELEKNFNQAVDLMVKSEMINLIAFRTSKVAALYFDYMLAEFFPNVRQLGTESDFIFDRLLHLDEKQVVVFIGLSPYTNLTVEAAKYCYEKGIPTIVITDQLSSPLSSYATVILPVKSSDKQYSIIPVFALIEAFVIEIGKRMSGDSISHLNELNKLLSEKNITTS